MQPPRYAAPELVAFANGLLRRVGVRDDIAATVADVLVTGDLLGHTTHGLGLLAPYLGELEKGTMTAAGEPGVQNARPAAELWDGAACRARGSRCARWTRRWPWHAPTAAGPW